MNVPVPESLGLIAGKGAYPRLLAESAKKHGVKRVVAVAFKKETDPVIEKAADEVQWVHLGRFGHMLEILEHSGVKCAVMAGQITPTHLFRLRPDSRMIALLKRLRERNAETIFGAVGEELQAVGVELMPASLFMEDHMPGPGQLSRRAPTQDEAQDIRLGLKIAKITSRLDIGQTVVVKQGTVLAVEAFEGTDKAVRRAGKLGGAGIVVAKAAKPGHDMRFDIPVVGIHTIALLRKVRAAALAVEANRTILLERDKVVERADSAGLALVAVQTADGQDSDI